MDTKFSALHKAHPDKVSAAYVDNDGTYWVELRRGWTADPMDAHDIAASSAADALRKFRGVVPCQCLDCRG